MKEYEIFCSKWLGVADDIDKVNGVQCADAFKRFCYEYVGTHWPCGGDGFVYNFWKYRETQPTAKYFDFIYKIEDVQPGDWVVWDYGSRDCPQSHIAMYVADGTFPKGRFFGQQQDYTHSPYSYAEISWNGFLGAFRLKAWNTVVVPEGAYDMTVNGNLFHLYRQKKTQKVGVLSAGINKLKRFDDFDADGIYQYCRAGNGNYFQMRSDQDDAYGTTYGDQSSPMSGTYLNLSGQDAVLYFDLNTGKYGECKGITIDPTHNVFSPAIVASKTSYDYAPMVGKSFYRSNSNLYTFIVRLTDGTYIFGCNDQKCTPEVIANCMRKVEGFETVSVIDGGGSSMLAYWKDKAWKNVRITDRRIASVLVMYEYSHSESDSVPVEEDIKEEPDGPGTTAELDDIKALREEVLELKKALRKLESDVASLQMEGM